MQTSIAIRPEIPEDFRQIHDLTAAAFATLEVSNHTEQYIIEALREANALTLSLVAEVDGRLAGHVAFSPVTMSEGTGAWFGLGPVSVWPELQGQGIGSALIREGLAQLRALGAAGCCVVGHPGYYPRFGFENSADLSLQGVPPEVFFVLPFGETAPQGYVTFHPAFFAAGPAASS